MARCGMPNDVCAQSCNQVHFGKWGDFGFHQVISVEQDFYKHFLFVSLKVIISTLWRKIKWQMKVPRFERNASTPRREIVNTKLHRWMDLRSMNGERRAKQFLLPRRYTDERNSRGAIIVPIKTFYEYSGGIGAGSCHVRVTKFTIQAR